MASPQCSASSSDDEIVLSASLKRVSMARNERQLRASRRRTVLLPRGQLSLPLDKPAPLDDTTELRREVAFLRNQLAEQSTELESLRMQLARCSCAAQRLAGFTGHPAARAASPRHIPLVGDQLRQVSAPVRPTLPFDASMLRGVVLRKCRDAGAVTPAARPQAAGRAMTLQDALIASMAQRRMRLGSSTPRTGGRSTSQRDSARGSACTDHSSSPARPAKLQFR